MRRLIPLVLLLTSCASYEMGSGRRQLPGGYDRVAIPMFVNRTPEVGIEAAFTDRLRLEFERSRIADVVSKDRAQVIVEGVISKVALAANSQTGEVLNDFKEDILPEGTVLSQEYAVSVEVAIVIRKVSNNKVLWTGSFPGSKTYRGPLIATPGLNNSNAIYNQSGRTIVITQLSETLMSEAHDQMTENF